MVRLVRMKKKIIISEIFTTFAIRFNLLGDDTDNNKLNTILNQ